jgi:lysozyme family protein
MASKKDSRLKKANDIIDGIIKREGGYVNDPDDPGGETQFGISKAAYPNLDIKNLTIQDARDIYYNDYWKKSKADKLPERLQEIYIDMVVNMGIRGAGKVLQQACNGKNSKDITVDGRVGPNTINATKDLELERLRAYRVLKFAKLIQKNPKLEKFWFGWFNRSLEV